MIKQIQSSVYKCLTSNASTASQEPEKAFNIQINIKTLLKKKVISCLFEFLVERTMSTTYPKMSSYHPSKAGERKSVNEAVGFPQDCQCHTQQSHPICASELRLHVGKAGRRKHATPPGMFPREGGGGEGGAVRGLS